MLFDVATAIAQLQPDAAIIENVAALLRPRNKWHFDRLTMVLRNAGYHVVVLELDAAWFGVPQHRRRMICFASKVQLAEFAVSATLETLKKATPTVEAALSGLGKARRYRGEDHPTIPRIANHVAMRHSPEVRAKISAIAPGKGPMSYRRLHPKKPARTLISGNRAPPAHPFQARSITAREAARLQGFPDSFVIEGGFSKQLLHVTNAVPPPLAKAALLALFANFEVSSGQTK